MKKTRCKQETRNEIPTKSPTNGTEPTYTNLSTENKTAAIGMLMQVLNENRDKYKDMYVIFPNGVTVFYEEACDILFGYIGGISDENMLQASISS